MAIKDYINGLKEKKEKYKSYAEDRGVEKKYAERQKSHYERALEKYMEEDRQRRIKAEVKRIEDHRRRELFGKANMLDNNKKFVGLK
jgi:hypothetical protein